MRNIARQMTSNEMADVVHYYASQPLGPVADEALAAYERALEPKKLVMLSGGHFDAYVKDFELASAPARDWFVTYLKKR